MLPECCIKSRISTNVNFTLVGVRCHNNFFGPLFLDFRDPPLATLVNWQSFLFSSCHKSINESNEWMGRDYVPINMMTAKRQANVHWMQSRSKQWKLVILITKRLLKYHSFASYSPMKCCLCLMSVRYIKTDIGTGGDAPRRLIWRETDSERPFPY